LDAVTFPTGSSTVASQAHDQIGRVADLLLAYPDVTVEIGGYTDAPGSTTINARLSKERADNVRQAMIDRGVESARVTAKGYGEQDPAETTSGESAANRRVVVRVMKRG
ncbi:MAG TPA: OmpA family protein, partial [Kofleriaceae bacterium]